MHRVHWGPEDTVGMGHLEEVFQHGLAHLLDLGHSELHAFVYRLQMGLDVLCGEAIDRARDGIQRVDTARDDGLWAGDDQDGRLSVFTHHRHRLPLKLLLLPAG